MVTELHLARRYLFRGKAKHLSFIGIISCLGVILGVASVIVAISIVNGIDGGLMERIMRFKDHLVIESFDENKLAAVKSKIESWDEVESAALSLQTQVFAKFKDAIIPLVVEGIDFNDEKDLKSFSEYIKEEFAGEGFFVGQGLREKFFINHELEFYPLEKRLKLYKENVRGFFEVGLYEIDNYYLITDLEKAKSLSKHYNFFLGVKVKDAFKVKELKEKILENFSGEIFVSTWIENNEALFTTLKLEKFAMFIILSLIILIASFNIFATLTVKVVEKTKDIGILKALGFTNRKILSIFTLQGVILGLIGVIGGSLLGLGICFILDKYPFIRLPQEIFFTEYLPIIINFKDVIFINALALAISFISSILPALKASKLSACEALRYE